MGPKRGRRHKQSWFSPATIRERELGRCTCWEGAEEQCLNVHPRSQESLVAPQEVMQKILDHRDHERKSRLIWGPRKGEKSRNPLQQSNVYPTYQCQKAALWMAKRTGFHPIWEVFIHRRPWMVFMNTCPHELALNEALQRTLTRDGLDDLTGSALDFW